MGRERCGLVLREPEWDFGDRGVGPGDNDSLGAAALAAALAVGLGARDIVTRNLDDRFGKNQ